VEAPHTGIAGIAHDARRTAIPWPTERGARVKRTDLLQRCNGRLSAARPRSLKARLGESAQARGEIKTHRQGLSGPTGLWAHRLPEIPSRVSVVPRNVSTHRPVLPAHRRPVGGLVAFQSISRAQSPGPRGPEAPKPTDLARDDRHARRRPRAAPHGSSDNRHAILKAAPANPCTRS
jgi:hypothetical protein